MGRQERRGGGGGGWSSPMRIEDRHGGWPRARPELVEGIGGWMDGCVNGTSKRAGEVAGVTYRLP